MKIIEKVRENKRKIISATIALATVYICYANGKAVGYNRFESELTHMFNKMVEAAPEFKDQYMKAAHKAFNKTND